MATTRTKTAKLPKLPYRDVNNAAAIYWLAAWFRNQSKVEAVEAIYKKLFLKADYPTVYGLIRSVSYLKDDADHALKLLMGDGHLLMAWHGTTALDAEVAA